MGTGTGLKNEKRFLFWGIGKTRTGVYIFHIQKVWDRNGTERERHGT
jgi:hypothetical protein